MIKEQNEQLNKELRDKNLNLKEFCSVFELKLKEIKDNYNRNIESAKLEMGLLKQENDKLKHEIINLNVTIQNSKASRSLTERELNDKDTIERIEIENKLRILNLAQEKKKAEEIAEK